MSSTDIKTVIREKYGEAAVRLTGGGSSCCGASPSNGCADPITSNLYDHAQIGQIPEEAVLASLGCGNPTAMADLNLVTSFSTSAPVEVSTCYCLPSASVRKEKPTAWI